MRTGDDSECLVDRRGVPRCELRRRRPGGLVAAADPLGPWRRAGGRLAAEAGAVLGNVLANCRSMRFAARRRNSASRGSTSGARSAIAATWPRRGNWGLTAGGGCWRNTGWRSPVTRRTGRKATTRDFPAFAEFIGAAGGGLVVRESDYAKVQRGAVAEVLRGAGAGDRTGPQAPGPPGH